MSQHQPRTYSRRAVLPLFAGLLALAALPRGAADGLNLDGVHHGDGRVGCQCDQPQKVAEVAALSVAEVPPSMSPMKPPKEVNRITKRIEENLICQCGCHMGLAVCDCSTAEAMRADIAGKMALNMSDRDILRSFVDKYGERVLAAPTREGFNWTAWITPFAAIGLGAAILYYTLSRWVRTGERPATVGANVAEPVVDVAPEDEERYQQRLQELLKKHY